MIKLIADCGSTKIDWAVVNADSGAPVIRFSTVGINAAVDSESVIADKFGELSLQLSLHSVAAVSIVDFYGAGCLSEATNKKIASVLRDVCGQSVVVNVGSDLLGAARAVCGHKPGIVCILGTGSNSCYYDGREILRNVPALGFILGDEGSGSVMGRELITMIFKQKASPELRQCFFSSYPGLSVARVVERVYRMPSPNAWLASFMPFIAAHYKSFAELGELVSSQLQKFVDNNLTAYCDCGTRCVCFVGSIARIFEAELRSVCAASGLEVGMIVGSPIEGLLRRDH